MGLIGEEYLNGIDKGIPFYNGGEMVGIPFNLQQLIDRYGKGIVPNELGIYHLWYEDRLIYVGMSRKLRGRLLGHLKDSDMPFHYVLWFCASPFGLTIEDILRIEKNMIKFYRPPLNSTYLNCN